MMNLVTSILDPDFCIFSNKKKSDIWDITDRAGCYVFECENVTISPIRLNLLPPYSPSNSCQPSCHSYPCKDEI